MVVISFYSRNQIMHVTVMHRIADSPD